MKISLRVLGAALWMPATLLGCSHADPGQLQTTQVTEIAYKQGIVHRAKEDFRDTTDGLSITPRIKGAIIADSQLNDKRNHINVNTKDYIVHLRGHVYNSAIKSRAGIVATRKLKKMHKNYKVSNELSIMQH